LLDRFEQGLEVAFAEPVVALALDELEEDRADRIGGKDLQQHLGLAAIDHALAVDQNAVLLQLRDILVMLRQAGVDPLEIGVVRWRDERQAGFAKRLDGAIDIERTAGDVLDAFAAIDVEIFLDLAGIAGILVDRNPDLAVRAGQRAREQAGSAPFNVEITNLAEVEELFIEAGPDIHPAAMDVVGEVIDIIKPDTRWPRIIGAEPIKLQVVSRTLGAVAL